MKNLLLFLGMVTVGFGTQAQNLVNDQNPNYKQSEFKYLTSLNTTLGSTETMNSTIAATYKAYDFQTAKAERKTERRNFRRERQLFGNYNDGYNNYNRYDNYYPYQNYYNPYPNYFRKCW